MNPKAEKIVNEMLESGWEPWMDYMLADVRNRWIEERTMGRGGPGGKFEEPAMTPEQAKAAWKQREPEFRDFIQNDPDVRSRLSGYYSGRVKHDEMGQDIKKAQLAAGEKPWDSYTQPQ